MFQSFIIILNIFAAIFFLAGTFMAEGIAARVTSLALASVLVANIILLIK